MGNFIFGAVNVIFFSSQKSSYFWTIKKITLKHLPHLFIYYLNIFEKKDLQLKKKNINLI